MTHGSLFSGIGGFDLAAQWMGWQNLFHCEMNPFGQKVLNHYWPDAELFTDITKSDFTKYANRIDILTGGFPCQPYSHAGKRLGKEDERHLWPEMLRAIREIQPSWVVGENVSGLISWDGGLVFHEVQTDLEAEGYEVQPFVLPACAVNAPHRRDRVWFIAYRVGKLHQIGLPFRTAETEPTFRITGNDGDASNPASIRQPRKEYRETEPGRIAKESVRNDWQNFPTQSPVCSRNDGLSTGLVGITVSKHRNESIKAYGNAIVPQVAFQIFKAIKQLARCSSNIEQ
jgi:DNA (cytosine-5)-methyltransferase 1